MEVLAVQVLLKRPLPFPLLPEILSLPQRTKNASFGERSSPREVLGLEDAFFCVAPRRANPFCQMALLPSHSRCPSAQRSLLQTFVFRRR